MTFVTVTFDFGLSKMYDTMCNVLIHSIIKNEPTANWIKHSLNEPTACNRTRSFISNTIKLKIWGDELEKCKDNDELVLIDCDTILLQSIKDVFENDFDIAYTIRTNSTFPINGGVIFIKVNDRSRLFFKKFIEINNKMFNNKNFHDIWRNKYAGINQSAFGYMLENEHSANLISVPCSIWNACNEDWEHINENTRIMHIKGQLRKAIFQTDPIPEIFWKASDIWRTYFDEWSKTKIDY